MDPRHTTHEPVGAPGERRKTDRRVAQDVAYTGPERRQQDRRARD